MVTRKILLATTALTLAAGQATALTATATTDLNLRAGPGPQYEIRSVIAGSDQVDVSGCLDEANWCEVTYEGVTGWAYAAYLTTPVEDEPVVLYDNASTVEVETVTFESGGSAADTVGTATWGAVAGALLIGGPMAVASGAILGAAAGSNANVETRTITHVRENPVEPVYLEGEVATGAGIPDGVEVHAIPDSDHVYLNVNNQPVVVETESRRIVHVLR